MRRKKYYFRRIFLFLFVLLLFIAVLTPFGRRAASAIAAPFSALAHNLADGIRFILPGTTSRKERLAELEAENQMLKAMLAETDSIRLENAALRKAANLPLPTDWKAISAEIIARDPERWRESFTINRGYEEGVKTGAAVIINGYFAGRITECHRHSAAVATIYSEQCTLSVYVEEEENLGVMQGGGNGRVNIKYLPREYQPEKGHIAVTSGMGGWMPSGIHVAAPVLSRENGQPVPPFVRDTTYCEASFVPLANISATDIVSVIVPGGGK